MVNISSQKVTALAEATAVVSSSDHSPTMTTVKESDDETKAEKKDIIVEDEEIEEMEDIDVSSLSYEDVDYQLSEMSPPFINEDQCLVPGEAIIRVEKATENSRRIFAGIEEKA